MRSMGVKGTPNVRRRPIARCALGALVGRRMDACTPSVIPAEAGIQAICGGQGHSQCSTAPDRARRARGSGRPSDGCLYPLRHSCGGRNPGDLWGSRALPMFDGARSRAARSGLWWAVGWMPVPPPSFLRRQESRRSVGVKGTPNVRRRPIARCALGALVGRRADGGSSHGWVVAWIPASAGMTDRAGVTDRGERDGRRRD